MSNRKAPKPADRIEPDPYPPIAVDSFMSMPSGHPDDQPEYEFETILVEFRKIPAPIGKETMIDSTPADAVKAMKEAGWEIDETIVCPPFALISFSREVIEEESEHETMEK